jgi:hypothetical protein
MWMVMMVMMIMIINTGPWFTSWLSFTHLFPILCSHSQDSVVSNVHIFLSLCSSSYVSVVLMASSLPLLEDDHTHHHKQGKHVTCGLLKHILHNTGTELVKPHETHHDKWGPRLWGIFWLFCCLPHDVGVVGMGICCFFLPYFTMIPIILFCSVILFSQIMMLSHHQLWTILI